MGSACGTCNDGSHIEWRAKPFAAGEYRKAYKGTYTSGKSKGNDCVVKVFKRRHFSDLAEELHVAEIAKKLADEFNKLPTVKRPITFVLPQRASCDRVPGCLSWPV